MSNYLSFARVLEIPTVEIQGRGSVPCVRYRECSATVSFVYKGNVVYPKMSSFISIDAAIEAGMELAARFGVDASSEAEILVSAIITERLAEIERPELYANHPRAHDEDNLLDAKVVLDCGIWSTLFGASPKLAEANALMAEGRACIDCMEDIRALFSSATMTA